MKIVSVGGKQFEKIDRKSRVVWCVVEHLEHSRFIGFKLGN